MTTQARFAMWVVAVALPAVLWAADSGTPRDIDVQKSVMTVRVSKAGLFSALGHEHEISAPIQQGEVQRERSVRPSDRRCAPDAGHGQGCFGEGSG